MLYLKEGRILQRKKTGVLVTALAAGGLYSKYQALKKGQSQRSWLLEKVFWATKPFPEINNGREYHKEDLRSRQKYELPHKIKTLFGFHPLAGMDDVLELSRFSNAGGRVIFYVHGGAYWGQPAFFHFEMLYKLAKELNARVVMPIYPKAPAHNALEVHQMILGVYRILLEQDQLAPEQIIFMGDSAGGGFLLSFMQELYKQGLSLPQAAFLISPWLDINTDFPEIKALQPNDPLLCAHDLKLRGRKYAGNLATTDPLVSPLYGNLENLPPIYVFTGTHDILHADALRLQGLATAQNLRIKTFTYPQMLHVFPLFPIPEAGDALRQISRIIRHCD